MGIFKAIKNYFQILIHYKYEKVGEKTNNRDVLGLFCNCSFVTTRNLRIPDVFFSLGNIIFRYYEIIANQWPPFHHKLFIVWLKMK